MSGTSGTPPETFLRDALEESKRENVLLQDRVRELEAAVAALKHSVFVLSTDRMKRSVVDISQLSYGPQGIADRSQTAGHGGTHAGAEQTSSESSATASSNTTANSAKVSNDIAPQNPAQISVRSIMSSDSALQRVDNTGGILNLNATTRLKGATQGHPLFVKKVDLIAHNAAVYAVKFSPNGAFLVSSSFDRSIVVWQFDNYISSADSKPTLSISDAHRAPVVDVAWTADELYLVSGGFDASVAEWNVETGSTAPMSRYHGRGLVNAVATSPQDYSVIFAATSRGAVHLFDRRVCQKVSPLPATGLARFPSVKSDISTVSAAARGPFDESTIIVSNDAPINSVYVELNGRRILTGDHGGAIKTWDLRMSTSRSSHKANLAHEPANLFDTTFNDINRRPITHIHASPEAVGDDHGRCIAINSYDNYLRVYDRGSLLFGNKKADMKPLHVLRGVVNRNWPIKSSFFVGKEYRPPRAVARWQPRVRQRELSESRESDPTLAKWSGQDHRLQRQVRANESSADHCAEHSAAYSAEEEYSFQDEDSELDSDEHENLIDDSSTDDDDDVSQHGAMSSVRPRKAGKSVYEVGKMPIMEAFILASGSADGNIFIYDVGGSAGTGDVVQILEEHRDRVHAVDFHPSEPILASCSADAQVKIWAPPARRQI